MSKLLLFLGVSGVGKSTIIGELLQLDSRFVYISPYTTRQLRTGEINKISISDQRMEEMFGRGDFLAVNELYGIRYATPRLPIIQALKTNNFPVLDWPISHIKLMTSIFPNQLYTVYILPPSLDILKQRLAKDNRDLDSRRFRDAIEELKVYDFYRQLGVCDLEVVSEQNKVSKIANFIYQNYLQSSSCNLS